MSDEAKQQPVMMPEQVMCRLGDLRAHPDNPREIGERDLEKLQRSLRAYGFVQPVVARAEDRLVLGGHQRMTAFRRILTAEGVSAADADVVEVPTIFLRGVSDARAKLLLLALNKVHGDWDYAKLSEVLASVDELDWEELQLSGFDETEIEDIAGLLAGPDVGTGTGGPTTDTKTSALRFTIDVATPAEAEECRAILREFGMEPSGEGAAAAFVAALRAAAQHRKDHPAVPVAPPRKRVGRARKAAASA